MSLQSKTVFIDTQTFVEKGLHFDNQALNRFCALCEIGRLNHLTTTVVNREIEHKITEKITSALSSLKSFRSHARILESSKNESIKAFYNQIDKDEILGEALAVFKEFLRIADSEVLNTNTINTEDILDLYFNKQLPFSDKKKHEFPDAISILTVLEYAEGEPIYVISKDNDLINFCSEHANLISTPTIDEFLSIYAEHEEKVSKQVKNNVDQLKITISNSIEGKLESVDVFNDQSCWENSEVVDFKVLKLHDFEPRVLSADDRTSLVAFEINIDMEFTVSGPDYLNGYHDKESDQVYTYGFTTRKEISTQTFEIEIWYNYEYDNESEKLSNFEADDIEIIGLHYGLMTSVVEITTDDI